MGEITCYLLDVAPKVLTSHITVFLGRGIGIYVYYKQKEYGLVRNRYLEEVIDNLVEQINNLL